ncbi:MAG: antitoxin [Actinobacteria bacterium]|nr:antitoxin [Actinomycetota bacterium]
MGLFDSLKSKLPANKGKIKQGIDKGADVVSDKAPEHADKIDQGAKVAKDATDKLAD